MTELPADDVDHVHGLVNPRLSDVFGLVIRQDEVDFAVPHLREDLPLCIDPFLLWKSGIAEYEDLHRALVGFIDRVRISSLSGHASAAHDLLAEIREPIELGLGYTANSKRGSAIGPGLRNAIVEIFRRIPQLEDTGLSHLEVLALIVPKVAEDRIGDITASVLKPWLAEYTYGQCQSSGVPTRQYRLIGWDPDRLNWRSFLAKLPYNPADDSPVILVPLDLLRRLPWINYNDYYKTAYSRLVLSPSRQDRSVSKQDVLRYNRANYETVNTYVIQKEQQAPLCTPHPLFTPLALSTLRRKMTQLHNLQTGRAGGADKTYEELVSDLLSSLLYPELDLAKNQVRTISGAHIRDIIFHNDAKTPFLGDLREQFLARQLVFELKNVAALDTEHVNQLYRYLDGDNVGRYGILVSRNPPSRSVQRNIVDLHSSKRTAIICLNDSDLDLMIELFEGGYRPVDALRKKHVEFTRQLPQ